MDDHIDRLRSGVEVIREICAEACVMLRKRGRGHQTRGGGEGSCEDAPA